MFFVQKNTYFIIIVSASALHSKSLLGKNIKTEFFLLKSLHLGGFIIVKLGRQTLD